GGAKFVWPQRPNMGDSLRPSRYQNDRRGNSAEQQLRSRLHWGRQTSRLGHSWIALKEFLYAGRDPGQRAKCREARAIRKLTWASFDDTEQRDRCESGNCFSWCETTNGAGGFAGTR